MRFKKIKNHYGAAHPPYSSYLAPVTTGSLIRLERGSKAIVSQA